MEDKKFIFISREKYDESLFMEVQNGFGNKPNSGGLWCSPANDEKISEWGQFSSENMGLGYMGGIFVNEIILKKDAKILYYKEIPQYAEFLKNNEDRLTFEFSLDFEGLAKKYDAIFYDGGYSLGYFYGWDVDTLLILNKDCIDRCITDYRGF